MKKYLSVYLYKDLVFRTYKKNPYCNKKANHSIKQWSKSLNRYFFNNNEEMASKLRNEVVMHVTTWVHLGNSKLCEQSQTEMGIYCVFHLYEMSSAGRSKETER